jgi:KaiC/GvpD/RAD55 family RecA-like ATPase
VHRNVSLPTRTGGSRSATPTTADLEQAKEDALLQLRIGRTAHYYTVIVAAALLLDGFLELLLPSDFLSSTPFFGNRWFLLPPVVAGVYLSFFGLRSKWDAFQLWPWELHFSLTVASVGASLLAAYLYFAVIFHFGPTSSLPLLPWFYPLALGVISLPLCALALTWGGWSRHKTGAFAAALLPVPIAFALYYPANAATAANELAVTLFASAVLFQMSGSFLHLTSSGTDVQERQVISSGQNRIVQLAQSIQDQQELLRFREAALGKHQAEVETADATLRRSAEALEDQRQRVLATEAEIDRRDQELAQREHDFEVRTAETNALALTLENRKAELEVREEEVGTRLPRINDREQRATAKEATVAQRESELAGRQGNLDGREGQLRDLESRLTSRQAELDQKTSELLQRESEIRSSSVGVGVVEGAEADRRRDIEQRETQLGKLKVVLDEQNAALGRKSRDLERLLLEAQRSGGEMARREEAITARQLSLERQETDLRDRVEVGTATRDKFSSAMRGFEERAKELERREADLRAKTAEIGRLSMAASQKESAVKTQEARVAADRSTLEKLERQVRERELALLSRSGEMPVRPGASPDTTLSAGLRLGAGAGADSLLRPPVTRQADRLPTGTPRLDDLLLGGLPPKSHLLIIGPPFTDKETLLYAFIAEGLRRGEPAVIVTAAQSPAEIEQKISVLLPQFAEFAQRGKVTWIDASTPAPTPTKGPGPAVKGLSDHAGILSALVTATNKAEASGAKMVRVGFLGLSATLAHADERAGHVFVQNLVGILKGRNALAVYAVDKGAISEAQIQAIQGRVDGSIECKNERGRSYLTVQGLGEVASREWIEFRATGRGLVIGSFSLERIR